MAGAGTGKKEEEREETQRKLGGGYWEKSGWEMGGMREGLRVRTGGKRNGVGTGGMKEGDGNWGG